MTMNPNTHTAVTKPIGIILAGGKSSRMGTDKATLRIGNESLLLRARRTLQDAGCGLICLSGHDRLGWSDDTIPDQFLNMGPVGGIVSALRWAVENAMSDSRLLFVPVDAPLLSASLLASISEAASESDGCCIKASPLPVALRTTESVLKQCTVAGIDLMAGTPWSVKRFIEPLALSSVDSEDAIRHQLVNVNTPIQWKTLLRELENRT